MPVQQVVHFRESEPMIKTISSASKLMVRVSLLCGEAAKNRFPGWPIAFYSFEKGHLGLAVFFVSTQMST